MEEIAPTYLSAIHSLLFTLVSMQFLLALSVLFSFVSFFFFQLRYSVPRKRFLPYFPVHYFFFFLSSSLDLLIRFIRFSLFYSWKWGWWELKSERIEKEKQTRWLISFARQRSQTQREREMEKTRLQIKKRQMMQSIKVESCIDFHSIPPGLSPKSIKFIGGDVASRVNVRQ